MFDARIPSDRFERWMAAWEDACWLYDAEERGDEQYVKEQLATFFGHGARLTAIIEFWRCDPSYSDVVEECDRVRRGELIGAAKKILRLLHDCWPKIEKPDYPQGVAGA